MSAGGRSRAPSPPRVRVSLSVVLGQCILESSVTQTPLHLTTKTHTLRVRATRAKHDRWGLMINGKCFLLRPHLGTSPCVRASRPPTPPAESWTGGVLWLKPVFISRQSLNKFRNYPSPIPKYSLQIIHSIILLFQIVNL